jgi:hypothetical protein
MGEAMSACCKGIVYVEAHDENCANNPARICAAAPDAGEPKAAAEKRMIDPETMKRFGEELRSLKADFFAARSEDEGTPAAQTRSGGE